MPRLIVGTEKNLSQLQPRLFRGRLTKAREKAALDALRKANPHLDFKRLKPGTVIEVPDLPEFTVQGSVSMDDVTSVGGIADLLSQGLDDAGEQAANRLKSARAERSQLSKLLRSKEVAAAMEEDPSLAAEVERAQAAIEAQDKLDKARGAAAKKAFRQWGKDLEEVKALLSE